MRAVGLDAEALPEPNDASMAAGLAPDGGLYVPERFPEHDFGADD